MRVAVIPITGAIVLALWGCGSKKGPPADWVARVDSLSGRVELAAAGGKLGPANKGAYLSVGGQLVTGADGRVTLALRNGGRLDVKPGTVLHLRSSKPSSQLGLKLMRGSVEGTAPQLAASDLVITVGGRKVRLAKSARATVTAESAGKRAALVVSFGSASIDDAAGQEKRVVAGETLSFTLSTKKPKPKPDAGVPKAADAGKTVTAPELVFYLKNRGRGVVMLRKPGERRFRRLRRNEGVEITPGTEIKLKRRARVRVGTSKGKGTLLRGPAQVVVRKAPGAGPDGKPGMRIESKAGDITISERGKAGRSGSRVSIEGVTIVTRVTYRKLDVKVRREKNRAVVIVENGEALLTTKDGKTTRVEAGQRAVVSRGKVSGPTQPRLASLRIKRAGGMRVFTASRRVPISLVRDPSCGNSLIEVARNRSFSRPLFLDAVRRGVVTLVVPRGSIYWRMRPLVDGTPGKGMRGRLSLLVDTSHRVLKTRAPRNTIDESYGNTTVYYQNALPRFTFRWRSVPGASRYQIKVFRERNLSKPLFRKDTRRTSIKMRSRRLAEGRYLWYVSARSRSGKLVKAINSRRLSIRYDNATPNLQIIYPRNGLRVRSATIEARGIAIRGSRVFVNGVAATLDDSYRFRQTVSLKPGANKIVFRVEDKRRGSSLYLRQVYRR